MAHDLREMFCQAFELSESDRATLAGLLIESLEPPPDPDVEELGPERPSGAGIVSTFPSSISELAGRESPRCRTP